MAINLIVAMEFEVDPHDGSDSSEMLLLTREKTL
jgi:hypothetical protein